MAKEIIIGQVVGPQGEIGPQGPEGPQGPAGPQGIPGSTNLNGKKEILFYANDWTAAPDGGYTLTIPAASHGFGASRVFTQVDSYSSYISNPTTTKPTQLANGDLVLYSQSRFDGLIQVSGGSGGGITDSDSLVQWGYRYAPSYSVAIGAGSNAAQMFTAVYGINANASYGSNSVAIGHNAYAGNTGATVMGSNASSGVPLSVAIGWNAKNYGNNAVAIGSNAQNYGYDSIVIGSNAYKASSTSGCVIVGNGSYAYASNVVLIGSGWKADNSSNTILIGGYGTTINAQNVVGIGGRPFSSNSVAIGYGARAGGMGDEVAIGYGAITGGTLGLAIGSNAYAASGSTAIGYEAYADSTHTIVLGNSNIQALRCQVQTISSLSDSRVKEDVKLADTDICLKDVIRLPVSRYSYKDFTGVHLDKHRTGFMADDVEQVFPKSVQYSDEWYPVLDNNGNQVYEAETDKDGNILHEELRDANNNVVYEQLKDEENNLVFNVDGQPVYDTTKPMYDATKPKMKKKMFMIEKVKSIALEMGLPTLWGAVQELYKMVKELKNAAVDNNTETQ